MIAMLAGFAIAAGLWWGLKAFGRADPRSVSRLLKRAGGAVALAVAAVLMLRGRLDMALLAGGVGAWLFGWADAPELVQRVRSALGLAAPDDRLVRSAVIELRCRADGRVVGGRVLAGPLAGRRIGDLSAAEMARLTEMCGGDPDSLRLLEAYLHRRASGGREDAEADPDARRRADPQRGTMSDEEAYEILGLQPGAGAGDVRAAHRALMKKLHPDQGGSTYLASRVNQAKDVLLNRHR